MLNPGDVNPGDEQFEEFYPAFKNPTPTNVRIQYDYRHPSGKLFSCVAKSLAEARERRDKWILTISAIQLAQASARKSPRP